MRQGPAVSFPIIQRLKDGVGSVTLIDKPLPNVRKHKVAENRQPGRCRVGECGLPGPLPGRSEHPANRCASGFGWNRRPRSDRNRAIGCILAELASDDLSRESDNDLPDLWYDRRGIF